MRFLKMNLTEAYDHIDRFIICECNRTHTGRPNELLWHKEKLIEHFPEHLRDKILYLPCDVSKTTVEAYEDEEAIHRVNEPAMRSHFMERLDFNDDDIVISIDADEIIYEQAYEHIINETVVHDLIRLNLHQFFWKMNYLWEGKDFTSAIAAKYKVFKNSYPCNWRDVGPVLPMKVGCHFSWCMHPEEMVDKLHTYSHPQYRKFADVDLLEKVIEKKEYPFDPNIQFDVRELEWHDEILPKSIHTAW